MADPTDSHLATKPEPPEPRVRDLAADWPGWRFWRAGGGSFMATRRTWLREADLEAGLAATLMADDEEELAAQLFEQTRLESS